MVCLKQEVYMYASKFCIFSAEFINAAALVITGNCQQLNY